MAGSLPTPLAIILVNAENRSSSGYAMIDHLPNHGIDITHSVIEVSFDGSAVASSCTYFPVNSQNFRAIPLGFRKKENVSIPLAHHPSFRLGRFTYA
jgi:hypothetical protein